MRALMLASALVAFGCSQARHPDSPAPNPNDNGSTFPAGSFGAQCNGQATAFTGVATAPNGTDPVALAHVYVVASVNPLTPGASCDVCDAPIDTALAETTATADGHFTLSLDKVAASTSLKLVVAKGRFRKATDVPVSACSATAPPAAALSLPGSTSQGDMPKIAVATGSKDHLDVVLSALGITEFDCYNGTKSTTSTDKTPCSAGNNPDIASLLSDPAKLSGYNMLFLSCSPGKFASLPNGAQAATNLEAWVKIGGRLFATDESYNYIEQAFPPFIDFEPGTQAPMTAQAIDQANVGVGGPLAMGGSSYPGTITDPDLETWMQAVGAIPPEANTITLNGFLNPWSAQKDVAMGVRTEVTATAQYYTTAATSAGSPSTSATLPMTVEWDYQMCGRVLFSSYHTLATTQQGSQLSGQEKILEYLVLDIGSCVAPLG